ncbi:MAG: magnesium transporter CorA family protein [Comamonas sp.]
MGEELPLAPSSATGFYWVSCTRAEFAAQLPALQAMLHRQCGMALVDLHVSDLLNAQLPSNYDATSQYDLLVFQRLASAENSDGAPASPQHGPPVLTRIVTRPVGMVVFDHLLLTVHPETCTVRAHFVQRLLAEQPTDTRGGAARRTNSPADLMLRLVNHMVDSYLELRRELTRQLDHWQSALLEPKARISNWSAILDARLALHQLDEICEDQRAAIQEWIEALDAWPAEALPQAQRERELLKVRSRDVLEHIERVVHHVRRLEQSAETAVQMHFSLQSNRANDIMRTLTTITAVFLPLNLIAAVFGMNFEFIPLVHKQSGFWWAMGGMGVVSLVLMSYFWRKRYLERIDRDL